MPRVPFLSLDYQNRSIEKELNQTFHSVFKNGRFILDEEVELFEKEFAKFHKSKYCIAVGNGHDALVTALKAVGVRAGDEVIVPSHTCQATWLAVLNSGAKPIPVEVDSTTCNINPDLIEVALTRRTKAIVPVHLYGHPCEMDRIMSIAERRKLFVVEDNAQAHGAIFKNKTTGSWGHCNATSFYPTKNLGALGDGGALITNEKRCAVFARAFRNYGSPTPNVHSIQGVNSRLDELQAAFLRKKLQKLYDWNEMRKQNAELYFELLKDVEIQLPPRVTKSIKPVFHLFVIQTRHRDKLKDFLLKKGIESAIHYPTPVHLQKAYDHLGYKKRSLPIAEELSKMVLSLPIWPGLKRREIEFVAATVKKFFC
jgi:dTDP-4-amino-4,6-dideoxygalactose transaminase